MNEKAIHPIIYVRGYAMREEEIEDTVADPYMGFNVGSSKMRQLWDGKIKKYYFESPLVRLLKEYGYDDVFDEGLDRLAESPSATAPDGSQPPVGYRSIVIYRYYEPSSHDLGTGVKPDMQRFATGLGDLILELRDKIYPQGAATVLSPIDIARGKLPFDKFRVHLVAHSMGGLVCRAFLQNPAYSVSSPGSPALVDKLFTYATPHNGIEVGLVGNVPSWLSLYGMNTFNRSAIATLLNLAPADMDSDLNVDVLTNFNPSRVFNLVGTNPGDYKVAYGFSSTAVGESSDGLVRIKNATTRGLKAEGFPQSPQAFVNRSHSGYYGIVNSEEGYQNLTRFLFGDVRADGFLDIDQLTLPPEVQKKKDDGKDVKASYQFEVTVAVRGKAWQLHRRTVNENSAIFRKFDDLFPEGPQQADGSAGLRNPDRTASPMLFNAFLDLSKSQNGKTLAFAADLCVRVPNYQVDGLWFLTDHFEGGYLFRDRVIVEATFPQKDGDSWQVAYTFDSKPTETKVPKITLTDDKCFIFEIPIEQPNPPGIMARLRIETRDWNDWQ